MSGYDKCKERKIANRFSMYLLWCVLYASRDLENVYSFLFSQYIIALVLRGKEKNVTYLAVSCSSIDNNCFFLTFRKWVSLTWAWKSHDQCWFKINLMLLFFWHQIRSMADSYFLLNIKVNVQKCLLFFCRNGHSGDILKNQMYAILILVKMFILLLTILWGELWEIH